LSEATIDTTDSIIRALDLNQEDGLLETRLSSELRSEEHTSSMLKRIPLMFSSVKTPSLVAH
jgi:hypothetical protein